MNGFFKNLGKGIGYFFAFPGLLIAIALYAVVGLFVFIFQFFKLIYLFFTGRNLFSDLPEDIALKAKFTPEPEPVEENKDNSLSVYPSDSSLYNNEYSSSMMKEKEEEDKPVVPIEVLEDDNGWEDQ